jgi:hypothetical protein
MKINKPNRTSCVRRSLSSLLAAIITAVSLLGSLTARAAVTVTGNCGASGDESSVVWTLDSSGTLSINGSGPMANGTIGYETSNGDIRDSVTSIIIGQGVTSIGNVAFTGFAKLASVSIADTVEEIGFDAFRNCVSLGSITIPASVKILGNSIVSDVFYGNISLKEVVFLGSPEEINVKNIGGWDYSKELTIVSRRDSSAKKYADKYGIPWRELPGQTYEDTSFPVDPALAAGKYYPGASLLDYAEIPVSILYSGDGYSLVETDLSYLRDSLATVPDTGEPMITDVSFVPLDGGYFLLSVTWDDIYYNIMRSVPILPDGSIDLDRITGSWGSGYNRTFTIMDSNFHLLAPIDVYTSCQNAGNLFVITDYTDCAFNDRGKAKRAVIDGTGKIIKPFGECDNIFQIGDTEFYHILNMDDNENWTHGLMTEAGEIVVPVKYNNGSVGSDGWYVPEDNQDVLMHFKGDTDLYHDIDYYYFDKTTRRLFKEPEFPEGWSNVSDAFAEGLMPLYRWEQSESGQETTIRGAYADKYGNIVLTLEQGLSAYDFFSGTNLARFGSDRDGGARKYGLIDKSGKIVLPAEYDSITAKMVYADYEGFYRPDITEIKGMIITQNGKRGFCDTSGKIVIPPIYDEVAIPGFSYIERETDSLRDGYQAHGLEDGIADDVIVVRNGKGPDSQYALYNIDGTVIVSFGQYGYIAGYSDGVVVVRNGTIHNMEESIYLDTHGKELFRLKNESSYAGFYNDGLVKGWQKTSDGKEYPYFVDKMGHRIIERQDIDVSKWEYGPYWAWLAFSDGIGLIENPEQEGYHAFIDSTGKTLTSAIYAGNYNDTVLTHGVGTYRKWDEASKTLVPVLIRKINTPGQAPAPLTAKPTSSTVLVNDAQTSFDAYNINDNNYFKLRDLAYVLSGTPKQFEVGYDDATKAITLTSGQSYTAEGGEMEGGGAGNKAANPTSSKIYLDGAEISLTAYNIGGYNYFKLRDIGQAFNFGVDWDGASQTIAIDTGKGYTPD